MVLEVDLMTTIFFVSIGLNVFGTIFVVVMYSRYKYIVESTKRKIERVCDEAAAAKQQIQDYQIAAVQLETKCFELQRELLEGKQ